MSDCFSHALKIYHQLRKSDPFNIFISFNEDFLQQYKLIRSRLETDKAGFLAGYILAIKDNINVAGMATTCGSRILMDYISPYDATVVEWIKQADGLILGKTNLDEFAMGSTTEYSCYGVTRNPLNPSCVAGGSSGGSAAAVAAGYVDLALGSDTGGSVRLPAAFCGVVGLKPTYGRVSRYGLVAFASSMDQIGILAGNVSDAARLLTIISGKDNRDETTLSQPVPDYLQRIKRKNRRFKIGLPAEIPDNRVNPAILNSFRRIVDSLEEAGHIITEVSLPHFDLGIPVYHIISSAEASSNLARFDGVRYGLRRNGDRVEDLCRQTRSSGFGPEVKRRILSGTFVLSHGYYQHYYEKALRVRRLIRDDFLKAFQEVDLIVTPTSPEFPLSLGAFQKTPLKAYYLDYFTVHANLGGFPAISLPIQVDGEQFPAGFQIMGKYFDEETILTLGHFIEEFEGGSRS